MKNFRDFEGKNIDAAIEAACRFFGKDRDDLEIEILSGGSSGIFGLVGVKQARIRAKVRGAVAPQQRRKENAPKREPHKKAVPEKQAPPKPEPVAEEEVVPQKKTPKPRPVAKKESSAIELKRPAAVPAKIEEPAPAPAPRTRPEQVEVREEEPADDFYRSGREVMVRPEDAAAVEEDIRSTVTTLLEAIAGRADLSIDLTTDPIAVVINDEENSGLIIGRDGQTITALQYLVNRIVSQKWPDVPRVQLDAGDYREKQEDQLKKTSEFLADKARRSGRVQTRSKGDGPMKRVLIIPKRNGRPKGKRPYQPAGDGE